MGPLTVAYILITVGLLMLLGELLLPSGLCALLAMCAIVAGVSLTFFNSEDPFTSWLTLLGVVVIVPVIGVMLFRLGPRMPLSKRLFLQGAEEDATVASMPVNVELEQLRGRLGRTISSLRPSGVTDFDGRRIDTISEGMMIDAGQWVRCIEVKAGKVMVRAVDKPRLEDLETADFS